MSDPRPATFDDIVVRDRWLLTLTPTPQIASTEAEERLLLLLHWETNDQGYADEMARWCEANDRWAEASAYHYAHLQAVARIQGLASEAFSDSAGCFAKSAARSAGPLPTEEFSSPSDIFTVAIHEGSPSVRAAAVLTLVYLTAVHGAYYDEVQLPARTRAVVQESLRVAVAKAVRDADRKGSHELVKSAAEALRTAEAGLRTAIDDLVRAPSMHGMIDRRERVLRALSFVEPFCLHYDLDVVRSLRSVLTTGLAQYVKELTEPTEQTFASALDEVRGIVERSRSTSSHFAACLFVPLLVAVEDTLRSHYQTTLQSQYAILSINLVKPEASRHGARTDFELAVTNSGSASARNLTISLVGGRDGSGITLTHGDHALGDLAPGRETTIRSSGTSLGAEFTLEATANWNDRSGSRSEVHTVKISPQRQLDWVAIEDEGSPYRIQSISDPARLKGRNQDLQRLRLGVQGGGSFIVTGQKRTGKTSLVRVFLQSLEVNPRQLPIYISVGELSVVAGVGDLGVLGRELTEQIAAVYATKTGDDVEIPGSELFESSGFNAPFTRFTKHLRSRNIQLVLALDDLDELPLQFVTGTTGRALFMALRSVLDSGHSLLFVGSERLPATMKEQSLRLNQPQQLKIDYLERDALTALIRDPTAEVLQFTSQAIEVIRQWSAGNPYFATMIGNAIWNRARQAEDYWVVDSDVRTALEDVVEVSERNSYEHFWADSPLAHEDERRTYERRSAVVLLALAESQADGVSFVDRRRPIAAAEADEPEAIAAHLDDLISRGVVETHPQNYSLVRIRVPLFARWLRHRGQPELQRELERSSVPPRQGTVELSATEVVAACDGLQYKGDPISTDTVRVWLSQFGSVERQRLVLPLLQRLRERGLYSPGRYNRALQELHGKVRRRAAELGFPVRSKGRGRGIVSNVFVTHADRVGKSGAGLIRPYRIENRIREENCGTPEAVIAGLKYSGAERNVLIVIDDFVGSGQSAVKGLRSNVLPRVSAQVPDWQSHVLILYIAIAGFAGGMERIEVDLEGQGFALCNDTLDDTDRAFHPRSGIFASDNERIAAQEMILEIGTSLEPDQPLGWEGSEALIVFPDRVSNNSLPVLYKADSKHLGRPWIPLFPR
jgi:hypothetical protein